MEGLNIKSTTKPVNQDITVIFNPSLDVVSYKYIIYKDNEILNEKIVNTNIPSTIILTETGNYKIEVVTTNKEGL